MAAPVTKNDAQQYFDRAGKFAEKHPDQHFTIYVRYFEVQERFLKSAPEVAGKALEKAAYHFDQYTKTVVIPTGPSYDPAEVFNPPSTGSQSVPDRTALREKQREVKSLFGDLLRTRGDNAAAVPLQLLNSAIESESDPALAYATALAAAEFATKRGVEDLWLLTKRPNG